MEYWYYLLLDDEYLIALCLNLSFWHDSLCDLHTDATESPWKSSRTKQWTKVDTFSNNSINSSPWFVIISFLFYNWIS